MPKVKKCCAVCADDIPQNVVLKWKRDSDNTVFHVCLLCAEAGKVNASSVKMEKTDKTITYEV